MKYLYLLLVIIPNSIFAQTSAEIQYDYISYAKHITPATLVVKDGNFWYSRHQEPATIKWDNGYEFYYYKDYKDLYFDNAEKTLTQVFEQSKYPPFYGQWQANMKWDISQETKMIGGYNVQKATTTSLIDSTSFLMITKVIAWFTTEIPISAGPEGYYGLPGLIVKLEYEGYESEETLKKIIFTSNSSTLKKIEYLPVEEWEIPDASGKITIQKEQFDNFWKIDKKWLKQQNKLHKKKNK